MWKGFIVTGALLLSSFTWATYYERGNQICEDFEEAESSYRANPENIHERTRYASCLVIKGEDTEGLSRLYHLRDHENSIPAAFLIAGYLRTGGTFGSEIDRRHYNEAISAYFKVLALINFEPMYPHNGNFFYELYDQMELNSYFVVPLIYMEKFKRGHYGTYVQKYMQSPNYSGEKVLNTYPEYSPYTQDSLRRVIEHAGRCAVLPKKNHFEPRRYTAVIKSCRLLKELAQELLPMEEERLSLLKECPDLHEEADKCPEYYELHGEKMSSMLAENTREIESLFAFVHEE